MRYPTSIQNLINKLSLLPSVGPKTAERYVFYLLKQNSEDLQQLAQAIAELKEKTCLCEICLSISETSPCQICADKSRDHSTIFVVSNTRDMLNFEAINEYHGVYHILGGALSVINGTGPDNLNLKQLTNRLKNNKIKELILALSPNLDGETTALYLAKLYKNSNLKITRLGRGLPTGSEIEYMDDITLSNALKYRNNINAS